MSAISVEGVSKEYYLGTRSPYDQGLRHALERAANAPWRWIRDSVLRRESAARTSREAESFWALRDVSFQVAPGEAMGIIGRNGAGKSTLLKILSRITEPSEGEVRLRGRVASLLEVGTGFHPELTGRENIFLNGAILGMSRRDIRSKFDEIVAFAEIDKFIDTPVKRYSSGMYVRLAFAVAAHLEPEILIIDEVLAVGDAAFQKKCLGKMNDISTGQGRTVLFVSHDMAAVSALTNRCCLLDAGRVIASGATSDVVGSYFRNLKEGSSYEAPVEGKLRPFLKSVRVITSHAPATQAAGESMVVEVEISQPCGVPNACLSFQIINQFYQPATHIWIYSSDQEFGREPGTTVLRCVIPQVRLNVGQYFLNVNFTEPPGGETFDRLEGICSFEVVRLGETTLWGWRADACAYHEEAAWQVSTASR